MKQNWAEPETINKILSRHFHVPTVTSLNFEMKFCLTSQWSDFNHSNKLKLSTKSIPLFHTLLAIFVWCMIIWKFPGTFCVYFRNCLIYDDELRWKWMVAFNDDVKIINNSVLHETSSMRKMFPFQNNIYRCCQVEDCRSGQYNWLVKTEQTLYTLIPIII